MDLVSKTFFGLEIMVPSEPLVAQLPKYQIDALPSPVKDVILKAHKIRKNSYCPDSGYGVACAIVTEKGDVFFGVNAETVNYDGNHGEDGAVTSYVTQTGAKDKIAYVVTLGYSNKESVPFWDKVFSTSCGRCRQRLLEFCSPDTLTVSCNETMTEVILVPLGVLLPFAFTRGNLRTE